MEAVYTKMVKAGGATYFVDLYKPVGTAPLIHLLQSVRCGEKFKRRLIPMNVEQAEKVMAMLKDPDDVMWKEEFRQFRLKLNDAPLNTVTIVHNYNYPGTRITEIAFTREAATEVANAFGDIIERARKGIPHVTAR